MSSSHPSSMYNTPIRQAMSTIAPPSGPSSGGNVGRFNDLFEHLKSEYEAILQESTSYIRHREEYEHKIQQQMLEIGQVQKNLYELERAHMKMKLQYEEDIARLKKELESRGIQIPPSSYANSTQLSPGYNPTIPSHVSSSLSKPPNLGNGLLSSGGAYGTSISIPNPSTANGTSSPKNHSLLQHDPPSLSNPIYSSTLTSGTSLPSIHTNGNINGSSLPSQNISSMKRTRSDDHMPTSSNKNIDNSQVPKRPSLANSTTSQRSSSDSNSPLSPSGYNPKPKDDWAVIYNPKIPKQVAVDLICSIDHGSVVCSVAFSPDDRMVASGSNKQIHINDAYSGSLICIFKDELKCDKDLYIRSLAFSPNGQFVASGAEDAKIRIWDIAQQSLIQTLTGHEQDIYSLQYSPDGRLIASASGDSTLRIWDAEDGKCLFKIDADESLGLVEGGITSLCFSPDGQYIATGSLDRLIRIWKSEDGSLLQKLDGHKNSVYSVQFSPDGKKLLSGSLDKSLKLWSFDPNNESICLSTFLGHKDFVLSVGFTSDNEWLVSGSKDRSLQFWDPVNSTSMFMLQGHKNSVISVAMSQKNGYFATGSGDFRARIWRYERLDSTPLSPNRKTAVSNDP